MIFAIYTKGNSLNDLLIIVLLKLGASLKGKNLLPKGANFFLQEKPLRKWE